MTETQKKVYTLIHQNPGITHADISQVLSATIKTAERTTKALQKLGIIAREGSDKTGVWVVLKKSVL